jgi:hypothetical protein
MMVTKIYLRMFPLKAIRCLLHGDLVLFNKFEFCGQIYWQQGGGDN